ncbi:inner membrane protein [Escherichia coli PCN061]|nr:inner membrane protein [Escherichia coli PCN061]
MFNCPTFWGQYTLGIDYMQGYLIGKPQPLIDTLNEIEPIRESA